MVSFVLMFVENFSCGVIKGNKMSASVVSRCEQLREEMDSLEQDLDAMNEEQIENMDYSVVINLKNIRDRIVVIIDAIQSANK